MDVEASHMLQQGKPESVSVAKTTIFYEQHIL